MALTLQTHENVTIGVRADTPLAEQIAYDGDWTAGGTRTPRTPDPAVPELSQIPIFFETNAQKPTLEIILEEYDAAPSGGGGG